MIELDWGARTDTGHRRHHNEDTYLATPYLFAVADGMGGHQRGEVASALAVQVLAAATAQGAEGYGRTLILDAVREADRCISNEATNDATRPMGTTLCGLAAVTPLQGLPLLVFNVGDSRVYRLRYGQLTQVSHDHSVVQELIDSGELDPDLAENHPERNVITRSLGSGFPIDIDWWTLDAYAQDRFLLCSDGLVRELTDHQLKTVLAAGLPPQATADLLLHQALESGGRDNVTVVVVDVVGVDPCHHGQGDDTNPRHKALPTSPRFDLPDLPSFPVTTPSETDT